MKNFYFQKKFSKNKYLKNNKIQNKDEYLLEKIKKQKKILTVKINHVKTLKIHHDIYMNYSQNCILCKNKKVRKKISKFKFNNNNEQVFQQVVS